LKADAQVCIGVTDNSLTSAISSVNGLNEEGKTHKEKNVPRHKRQNMAPNNGKSTPGSDFSHHNLGELELEMVQILFVLLYSPSLDLLVKAL